jgi:hypothetical protein
LRSPTKRSRGGQGCECRRNELLEIPRRVITRRGTHKSQKGDRARSTPAPQHPVTHWTSRTSNRSTRVTPVAQKVESLVKL